jgi:hypothetical protein
MTADAVESENDDPECTTIYNNGKNRKYYN